MLLTLTWDFRGSFPQPTEQAIKAGMINTDDLNPETIRGIHQEHAREMLLALRDLDAVLDARRGGIDPVTLKSPATDAERQRLAKLYETEAPRLERWFDNLLGTYADVFGVEAADAFGKAVRAWHAGIQVVAESPATANPVMAETQTNLEPAPASPKRIRHEPRRITARLPVPRPLPSAIEAGHFGYEDDGRPVNPGPREVREITQAHADLLVDLLPASPKGGGAETDASSLPEGVQSELARYAEDFGERAAEQLLAYCCRQSRLTYGESRSPTRGH